MFDERTVCARSSSPAETAWTLPHKAGPGVRAAKSRPPGQLFKGEDKSMVVVGRGYAAWGSFMYFFLNQTSRSSNRE